MKNFYVLNKIKALKFGAILLTFSLYSGFILYYLNATYPMIGHDYSFFFPRLLDEYTHLKINGLSIQWFTPSFGGGLPAFSNPQNQLFSLPQLFMVYFNPWGSVLISGLCYSAVGFWALYRFGKDVLKTTWLISLMGATLFMVNGFFIEHFAAGHLTFQTFPLVAVFLYLFFSPRLSPLVASILIAFTGTILIYSGSFYNIQIMLLSLFMSISLVLFFKPELLAIKEMGLTVIRSILLFGLFSAGKLYAVLSFMKQAPRIIGRYAFYEYFKESLFGVVWEILGVMTLAPYYFLRGDDPEIVVDTMETMARFTNIWETDISLSPVLIVLVLLGFLWVLFNLKNILLPNKTLIQLISLVFLFFSIWLTFEFSTGRGALFETIGSLPIVRSMWVNQRNVASYILPAALFATLVSSRFFAFLKSKVQLVLGLSLTLLTVAFLGSYLLLPNDLQGPIFNVENSIIAYENIKRGDFLSVSAVQEGEDKILSLIGLSSLYPQDSIFGYALETFNTQLITGSPYLKSGAYYNFTNPMGLVYPEESGVLPFERFKIEDKGMLKDFLNRKQPDWDIPNIQINLIRLNVLSLIICLSYLFIVVGKSINLKSKPRFSYLFSNRFPGIGTEADTDMSK